MKKVSFLNECDPRLSFPAAVEQLSLNQRVQGWSPCAPTIKSNTYAAGRRAENSRVRTMSVIPLNLGDIVGRPLGHDASGCLLLS